MQHIKLVSSYSRLFLLCIPVFCQCILYSTAISQFWGWSWNFLCANMIPFKDSKMMSVCPYPEKINNPCFNNVSPAASTNWCLNLKVFTGTASMETQKLDFLLEKSSKLNFALWSASERKNHHISVNIIPAVVNCSWTEWYSWVLQHENPKIWLSPQNWLEINFDLCWNASLFIKPEITSTSSMSIVQY